MSKIRVGSQVKIESLELTRTYIGLDGEGSMEEMVNDGRIYHVKSLIDDDEVLLDNTFYYHPSDLELVLTKSPYKKAKTSPQLFDIKNLE